MTAARPIAATASRLVWRGAGEAAPASDLALARAVAGGDTVAFHQLVDRHLAAVASFARRLLAGNAAEAEDVAQEAFIRLWHAAAGGGEPIAAPRAWLFRVAYRYAIDRRRRSRTAEGGAAEAAAMLASAGPSAERTVHDRELAELVERALAELPERQRAAILLCYHEGLSNAEAGQILGVSIEAVESLLARARRGLKVELQRRGGTDFLGPLE